MQDSTRIDEHRSPRRLLGELGGACGDLGTLLPYAVGAMTVAGLAPLGVLFGFGVFFVASGLFYGLPMAVQPMKMVGAILLTGGMSAGEVAATGMVIGIVLLVLGLTGAIGIVARLIPQSVTAGLQLGLGLTMGLLGFRLMGDALWFGLAMLAVLIVLMRIPRWPAAPITLLVAAVAGQAMGIVAPPEGVVFAWRLPWAVLPSWEETWRATALAVLPQLPLTLTNAVVVTAILSRELFPDRSARATERNLTLSTGIANLTLAPFGAMPMCHGAGGLQAQYRFGARTGLAPILLGALLLILALGFSDAAAGLLGLIPLPALGALLMVAGADLALSKRLFDARPACRPAIALTAGLTLFVNPAAGLAAGWLLETARTRAAGQAQEKGSS